MVKVHEPTSVDDVIDHFDHARNLVGIEHAGVGSDIGIESNDFMPPDQLAQMLAGAGSHSDFDERTMRYFDPTLRRGLIHSVKVTPLHGNDWLPGPIAER